MWSNTAPKYHFNSNLLYLVVKFLSWNTRCFALPSGLGLTMPCVSASLNFSASQCSTQVIVKAIKDLIPFELDSHELMLFEAQKEYKRLQHLKHADLFDYICSQLDPIHQRALLRAKDNDLSVWLSVIPTERYNFDLLPQEFRDALAISAIVNLC